MCSFYLGYIGEILMKKIALASAIALASISAAHAAPTVYGKVLLTGEYNNTDYEDNAKNDESVTKLQSNSSRIGFKGDEELTDTTKLVYQLEYGVDVDADSNGKGQFYSRNTFIGLAHNTMGTVLAGRHDTPYKLAKGGVDVFNDYDNVGLGNLMVGEQRANNVLAYKSPAIVGMPVTFMAAVALSESDLARCRCFRHGQNEYGSRSNFGRIIPKCQHFELSRR